MSLQTTEVIQAAENLASTPILLFLFLVLICGITVVMLFLRSIERAADFQAKRDELFRNSLDSLRADNSTMQERNILAIEKNTEMLGIGS